MKFSFLGWLRYYLGYSADSERLLQIAVAEEAGDILKQT